MKRGDKVTLTAQHLTLRGDGMAEHEGRTVHVPFLFAGERAEVRIEDVSVQQPRAFGTVRSLIVRNSARRVAMCSEHASSQGACGGCPLMELAESAQREQKVGMLRSLGLEIDRVESAERALGYRMSSKRVAFGRGTRVILGSYVRDSHDLARMNGCKVDHPRIVQAFAELEREATKLGVREFDARTQRGELRYAWAKTDGTDVLLTLITATDCADLMTQLAMNLSASSSVAWSVQPSKGNTIRGEQATVLRGTGSLTIVLSGIETVVGPLGFLQPNPPAIEAVYEALVDAPAGALAFDLYAGIGVTTALLRRRFAEVTAVEHDPASAGSGARSVESFLAEWTGAVPDLVIANPPRKGFGPTVVERLVALHPPRIHIMSCGPEGLARDIRQLEGAGYTLERLRAFDTLPQTPHVELIAHLVRA